MDRSQRVGPRRDDDRALRLDDRPAALPAESRAGQELRQVPRSDRRAPLPADCGARGSDLLAVSATTGRPRDPRRDGGLDRAHRPRRRRCVRDRARTLNPTVLPGARRVHDRGRVDPESRRRPGERQKLLLLLQHTEARRRTLARTHGRSPFLRCCAPLRLQHRGHRHRSAESAARVGGVDRRTAGHRASSSATRPVGSIEQATSSCTSPPPTRPH